MKKKRLPPHIVLPDGRWRFVKKGAGKTRIKRRNNIMARRRKYYSRARRYYTRARGRRGKGGGGVTKNIIDGLIVGVAQTALPDILPMQDALICTGVGWFRHNPTLITLGGVQLGASLGSMVGGKIGGGGASQV